jgi:hypothetical protein
VEVKYTYPSFVKAWGLRLVGASAIQLWTLTNDNCSAWSSSHLLWSLQYISGHWGIHG